ncbi:MAG: PPOX class F420-dependent oxidoreductase [Thermoproteota archaeon]|nr:PPOX class F420-dependent oxidoreductase [Thermoproteota archaeon]
MSAITPLVSKLLKEKNFASFATVMPNGSPQVTPVWIDYDEKEDSILVNTAKGRLKERNIHNNNKVALSVFDMDNPYEMVSIQGSIKDKSTDGADDHIDRLSKKYLGLDSYPFRSAGETRIILKIKPEKVFHLSIPIKNLSTSKT